MSNQGLYSASLLGTIKSHLEGLQGYEVMALELIQNADDAKADSITFDICEDALYVTNSEAFSNCGNVTAGECRWLESDPNSQTCDFHRITEVASGGKLRHPDNIGRFGIGFVSVYQITDHPEITSNGVHLTLMPEAGRFEAKSDGQTQGTRLRLPWAMDSNSSTRQALRASTINQDDMEALPPMIAEVLRESLLFLRHVRHAEVRVDGNIDHSYVVRRTGGSGLVEIESNIKRASSSWYVLHADAEEVPDSLYDEFPVLQELQRSTEVTVAIPLQSTKGINGRFFAFLPTEQEHGLSLHINADFFPEPDRKAIVLAGSKHQQAWNTALIESAAIAIADHLSLLPEHLPASRIWGLIDEANRIKDHASRGQTQSELATFWSQMERVLADNPPIAMNLNGGWCPAADLLHTSITLNQDETGAIRRMGGQLVHRGLSVYRDVLLAAGATHLGPMSLAELLNTAEPLKNLQSKTKVEPIERRELLEPLWSIVDKILAAQDGSGSQRFSDVPLFLTYDDKLQKFSDGVKRPQKVSLDRLLTCLAALPLPSPRMETYENCLRLVSPLDPARAVEGLADHFSSAKHSASLLSLAPSELRSFYLLLRDLMVGMDREADQSVLSRLGALPIFRAGAGLVAADDAFLPGDFEDPIGVATILNLDCYDAATQVFLREHLGVKTQSLENYVTVQLPGFFSGEVSNAKYEKLLSELAKHPNLLEAEGLKKTLADLQMVPTRDGKWYTPGNVYKHTKTLEDLLGFGSEWWLDESRTPNTRTTDAFLLDLGVREVPCAAHLMAELEQLAEADPNDNVQKRAERLFYAICDSFDRWEEEDGEDLEELRSCIDSSIFPANGVHDEWFSGAELYAPYRPEAFASQVNVLPFRNLQRLSRSALEFFGFNTEPETEIVIAHLRHCVTEGLPVSPLAYQVLHERAKASEGAALISELRDEPCIWNAANETYLKPGQLYWSSPRLGRYGYQVPSSFENYRRFLDAAGVCDYPTSKHYLDIVYQISNEYGEGTILPKEDASILRSCLRGVAETLVDSEDELMERVEGLMEIPAVLTKAGTLAYADEVAIADSEWHIAPFGEDVWGMLVADEPELIPLYACLDVVPASKVVKQNIDDVRNPHKQNEIAALFAARASLFVRILHDQPLNVRKTLYAQLSNLQVLECDSLRLKHTWALADTSYTSEPQYADAYFDADEEALYVVGPAENLSWAEVLRATFHAVLPHAGGSDLPSLVTVGKLVMQADSTSAAIAELDDSGYPVLAETWMDIEKSPESQALQDLPDMDLLDEEDADSSDVAAVDALVVEEDDSDSDSTSSLSAREDEASDTQGRGPTAADRERSSNETSTQEAKAADTALKSSSDKTDKLSPADRNTRSGSGSGDSATFNHPGERTRSSQPSDAPASKRRNRLRSYVTPRDERSVLEKKSDGGKSDHVYEVEAAARVIVCQYEEKAGRMPEEMPPMNPGFDIKSYDANGKEARLIEVKSIDGEWTDFGVGLKRRQFSEAWDEGDRFWLYVVEFARDPEHAQVYAIQNPAMKVDEFFFDQNWREVSESRAQGNHPNMFRQGTRIKHRGLLGSGTVYATIKRGQSVELIVDLDRGGRKKRALNIAEWEFLDEDGDTDGDDIS